MHIPCTVSENKIDINLSAIKKVEKAQSMSVVNKGGWVDNFPN